MARLEHRMDKHNVCGMRQTKAAYQTSANVTENVSEHGFCCHDTEFPGFLHHPESCSVGIRMIGTQVRKGRRRIVEDRPKEGKGVEDTGLVDTCHAPGTTSAFFGFAQLQGRT